jgi:hypothetical protein
MQEPVPNNSVATGLYWLAFLLTECQEISTRVIVEVLSTETGIEAMCHPSNCHPSNCHRAPLTRLRRAVIAQSLAAKAGELAWERNQYKGKPDYEFEREFRKGLDKIPDFRRVQEALLAIDLFPRHALLLTVFEGLSVQEAATFLHSDRHSICEARTDALVSLARNMACVPSLQRVTKPPLFGSDKCDGIADSC